MRPLKIVISLGTLFFAFTSYGMMSSQSAGVRRRDVVAAAVAGEEATKIGAGKTAEQLGADLELPVARCDDVVDFSSITSPTVFYASDPSHSFRVLIHPFASGHGHCMVVTKSQLDDLSLLYSSVAKLHSSVEWQLVVEGMPNDCWRKVGPYCELMRSKSAGYGVIIDHFTNITGVCADGEYIFYRGGIALLFASQIAFQCYKSDLVSFMTCLMGRCSCHSK